MTEYMRYKESTGEKIGFVGFILAMCLLFVALSQPVWRGQQMIDELKSDCKQQHGVLLTHEKMFGMSYECAPYLDK